MGANRQNRTSAHRARRIGAGRKRSAKPRVSEHQGSSVHDIEDLLIGMLVGCRPSQSNGTSIENLIYSTTSSTAELGYDFGFSVGRSMAFKLGKESGISSVLDRIGLKDSLYNPFVDEVMITSMHKHGQRGKPGPGAIHIYESGVIAGYLSASTGIRINASERRCVYSGSGECQFSASYGPRHNFYPIGISQVIAGIASELGSSKFARLDDGYYRMLACVPLLDSRLSEQVSKIMFMTGEKLARSGASMSVAVENVANYFGASASSEKRGRKSIIRLRFESYNSARAFVAMPAAIIAGLFNARGMSARVDFSTNSDSTYTAVIEATRKI